MISQNVKGIAYAISAFFMVAVTHILVKQIGESLPLSEVMMFRFGLGLLFLWPLIRKNNGWRKTFRTKDHRGMFSRALLGLAWIGMTFYSLRHLPVAPATAIWASAPLFVTALSAPLLKEQVNKWQWIAILMGLSGVLLIARPESLGTDNHFAIVIMVVASLAAALSNLQVRHLTFTNKSLTIVAWYFLIALVPSTILTIGSFKMPDLNQSMILLGIGLSGSIMMMLNTQAYRYLNAATVAVYEYTVILWTAIFGWFLFGEAISFYSVIGAFLIVCGGVAVSLFKDKT